MRSTRQGGYRGPDIVSDGLILYLDANTINSYPGTGTTWKDISGNNNVATLYNGVQFNLSYMSFDGIDDVVRVPDSALFRPSVVSLSSWFRRTGTLTSTTTPTGQVGQDARILAKDFSFGSPFISYGINANSGLASNTIAFELGLQNQSVRNLSSNVQAPLNTWVNTTCTYDGSSMKIYINGVLANSVSASGTILYSTWQVNIGGLVERGISYFKGDVATSMLYNRALEASEVAQIFESARSRFGI